MPHVAGCCSTLPQHCNGLRPTATPTALRCRPCQAPHDALCLPHAGPPVAAIPALRSNYSNPSPQPHPCQPRLCGRTPQSTARKAAPRSAPLSEPQHPPLSPTMIHLHSPTPPVPTHRGIDVLLDKLAAVAPHKVKPPAIIAHGLQVLEPLNDVIADALLGGRTRGRGGGGGGTWGCRWARAGAGR